MGIEGMCIGDVSCQCLRLYQLPCISRWLTGVDRSPVHNGQVFVIAHDQWVESACRTRCGRGEASKALDFISVCMAMWAMWGLWAGGVGNGMPGDASGGPSLGELLTVAVRRPLTHVESQATPWHIKSSQYLWLQYKQTV